MRALRSTALAVILVAVAPCVALAQAPVDPGTPLPPGHPAVGSAPAPAGSALPPGHPAVGSAPAAPAPVDPAAPLPPGHPSIDAPAPDSGDDDSEANGSAATPPGHPGMPGMPGNQPPQDRVSPAPDLRAGTIEVHVHGATDIPVPNLPVRLGVMKQDVAEGDSHTQRDATTDARGVAVFEGLPTGTAYTFRATVDLGPAAFASEPMRLGETGGQRALLHVFPVTRDLREALIGLRGVLFVQPREDVFHVEANFQVLNIGQTAWVPDHVGFPLPDGAKAFRASDSMSDARADRVPSGNVELLGTYSPGQHDVGYQFQLDNKHDARRVLRVALPPHVAELRVVAEGVRGMVLRADGFPDAEPMQGQDGSKLLVTGRRLTRGDPAMQSVEITLDNLPVPSLGRWYAVVAAVCIALLGLFQALRGNRSPARRTARADEAEQAEGLVLDELVALERLRRDERIGPRTYEETRVELLEALARLQTRRSASA
jgi:hypothetical protein